MMSDLVCIAYPSEESADKVLNELRKLQVEYLIDLEDSCVVVRDADGKVHLKQAVDLPVAGAVSGSMWGGLLGMLVGSMVFSPLLGWAAGAAIGAGTGAWSGKHSDYGINDDFIKSLGSSIKPGSSALFVLVRKVTADKVVPEIQKFGGTVLKTSLSKEQEERLQASLTKGIAGAA